MRYKLLGKSGLRVSELCLGTMTFGEDWGWGASKEESRKIFDAFAEAGGNFIDTSSNYTNGTSETLRGRVHRRATGTPSWWRPSTPCAGPATQKDLNAGGNHRKNMQRTVEESLKRLNTEYIDLLYLHMWDFTTPVEEVLRGLDDLVRAGKIAVRGHLGHAGLDRVVSARPSPTLRGWSRLVAYQGEYSLMERGIEYGRAADGQSDGDVGAGLRPCWAAGC